MSGRKRIPGTVQVRCEHCHGSGLRTAVPGQALRAHRVALGWTLRAFAVRLGFTAPYLCDVEYGRRRATEAIVEAYETAPVAP